jgi:hypothetical protein
MRTLRAIMVAVVAFAVAMLPVGAGMVRAQAAGMSDATTASDCCPHTKPCEKKTANDCGSDPGCMLKCFNFSGVIVSGVVAKLSLEAPLKPDFVSLSSHSNLTAPPLPPPRV